MTKKRDVDSPEAAGTAGPDPSPAPDSDSAPSAISTWAGATSKTLARLADTARTAATGFWRRAGRLSLRGARVTRPLEIALRVVGLVVAGLAPVWPLFGSDIVGWWDWLLTTLANLGAGIALFGAGEIVRMIADIHGVLVRETEQGRPPVEEDEA